MPVTIRTSTGGTIRPNQFSAEINSNIKDYIIEQTQDLYDEIYTNIKRDNPVDTGASQAAWEKTKEVEQLGDIGLITNSKDYVIYLEEGSSTQAPDGFIRRNIIRSINDRTL